MLSELWSELRYRVRAVFRRDVVERELSAELEDHIVRAAEKYERAGMTPGDAMRRARLEFGGGIPASRATRVDPNVALRDD